jgi:thiamine biosynthesis lipoprotein
VFFTGPASSPARAAEEVSRSAYVMGTLLRVTLSGGPRQDLQAAADRVFDEVSRWDRRLSTYKDDSDVSRVNRGAGDAVRVSSDTFRALQSALAWCRRTGGALDVTVGPLVTLWGFDGSAARVPAPEEIDRIRPLVSWEHVSLDETGPSARLDRAGMRLDFGAVGKGWALDRALERIAGDPAVEAAVMDFGGQLSFWARGPASWPATVRHPRREGETLSPFIVRANGSLSTSAASEKFVAAPDPKGTAGSRPRRYGHILDPRTGSPAGASPSPGSGEGAAESVTVWAPTAEAADALSTALFVMGPVRGVEWAEREKVAALFVFDAPGGGLTSRSTEEWERTVEGTR